MKTMPFDLHDLKIDEVSFCKKGKNKGAKVALYKAENNEEVVKALFNEILAGMELNESVSK
ncbi:MAG: hypothetical protein GWN01_02690, partial [Nitrosopumilaceae archaeon]|nr:hypothetical protein [Nitrosopumilaceae archaeon]NIV64992.1 hypothetical protein [Nitrosopumilaceae archaeon]NIX60476.1 hypothetical protein [Nitrosopumilaceae archaeon]